MALPMYKHPTYTLKLPATGKEIKYRPFLVKDEKNLLLAQQSEVEMNMLDTLKNVIKDCVLSKGVDVEDLPIFDLEYIFTQLRTKSVGENVELLFTCSNDECKEQTKISFKIDPKLEIPEGHSCKIDLFDDVGVMMKYANVEMLREIAKLDLNDPDQIVKLICKSIEYIYDSESVYQSKDQTEEEMIKFVEGLPRTPTEKIRRFFETTPKLQQVVEYDCPSCNHHNKYTVEGIESFF
jgi:hypothetical protein